jgi:hypothetical protein
MQRLATAYPALYLDFGLPPPMEVEECDASTVVPRLQAERTFAWFPGEVSMLGSPLGAHDGLL